MFFFDTYIESTYTSCTRNIFRNIIAINYLHGQSFNLYENREGESNSSFISGHSNGLTFLAYFSLVGLLPGTYLEGVWSKLIISDGWDTISFYFLVNFLKINNSLSFFNDSGIFTISVVASHLR